MRKLLATTLMATTSMFAGAPALAQAPAAAAAPSAAAPAATGPAWADPANWRTVTPIETDNIVYATVPHINNPSAEASPNPGTPNGIRPPCPTPALRARLDMHLDVYQVPSSKPTPVVIHSTAAAGFVATAPAVPAASAPSSLRHECCRRPVPQRHDAPAPAAVQDVLCAMSWVKKNAAKYNFDPNKVVTWGGSAADTSALMAGYAPASMDPPGCTDQPKVVAVIDMYGASDVAESLTYRGSMGFTHQWIGLDLPLPRDPAPAAAAAPATAASAARGGLHRYRQPRWHAHAHSRKLRAGLILPRPYSPVPARYRRSPTFIQACRPRSSSTATRTTPTIPLSPTS